MAEIVDQQRRVRGILEKLQIQDINPGACTGPGGWIQDEDGVLLDSVNPATGERLAGVVQASAATYDVVAQKAVEAFHRWRLVPAPKRGEVVRDLGNALREQKEPLAELVTLEMGKIRAEGLGEVQEMIDICDFSVGLSRQLYGLTMHSERPAHRMYEQWHPLGPVGIISAFNFPVAVWAWNAAIAAVCGDSMIWKPSSSTPLTAVAVQHICNRVCSGHGLDGLFGLVVGRGSVVGEKLITDPRVPLISFTGSVRMGRHVAVQVSQRLGRSILELGGGGGTMGSLSVTRPISTWPLAPFCSAPSAPPVSDAPRHAESSCTARWPMNWSIACLRAMLRCRLAIPSTKAH